MSNKPNKKKRRLEGDALMHRFLSVVLGVIALAMVVLVGMALHKGIDTLQVARGTELTPDPAQLEAQQNEASTEAPPQTNTQTPQPTEEEDPYLEQAERLLAQMTPEEKVCQLIIATPDILTGVEGASAAGTSTQAALEAYPIAGLIYEAQNVYTINQLSQMISNSQSYCKIPLFIGAEEEGGSVTALSSVGLTSSYGSMQQFGATGNSQNVAAMGEEVGRQMASIGFNLNLAPVADVLSNEGNTEIGSRSFGTDADTVSRMSAALMEALQSQGVTACVKHFPGLGCADGNTHSNQPFSLKTMEELQESELIPFVNAVDAGAKMIMVSHMALPSVLQDETPCSLSYHMVTEILREEIGFRGVIISDAQNLPAVTNNYLCGELAVKTLQAGCDMILNPLSVEEAAEAILAAVARGDLTQEQIDASVLRVLRLKYEQGLIS